MSYPTRHKELCRDIMHHDRLYYQDDSPEISDADYDRLRSEIEALEVTFPELAAPDSPTQKVGYVIQSGFKAVKHSLPMLSLAKAHSSEELRKWGAGIEKKFRAMPEETRLEILREIRAGRIREEHDCRAFKPVLKNSKVLIIDQSEYDGLCGTTLSKARNPFEKIPVSTSPGIHITSAYFLVIINE